MFQLIIPPRWQEAVREQQGEISEKMGMLVCVDRMSDRRVVFGPFKDYWAVVDGLVEIREIQGILLKMTGQYFDILILN